LYNLIIRARDFQSLGQSLFFEGNVLMANGNPVRPEGKGRTQEKQVKKPYTKPAFRFEKVFETQALSCGKVIGSGANCVHHKKAS
jgi:hypothetical protein